ncbi:MAG TPA: plasmid pRiA4b ORF-3 family protein [Xanthobacteraceae bacterium]|nr:plasmid pRiA4b ORF-3 family protein [Xanthobacteraceae bacterium]
MTAAGPAADIARLCVEIDDVTPRVQRVVEVPLDIRLDDLHFVLQIAIGWQNGHPFEFRIGGKTWGLPDREAETNPLPADAATLADILAVGGRFHYDYVLGEDWEHIVTLQSKAAPRPGLRYPHLVSAEGRCPPADIGGPTGYETYLRSIADPASVHHDAMLDFDAPDFDPQVVDVAALRNNLAALTRYIGRKPIDPHPEERAQRASKDEVAAG